MRCLGAAGLIALALLAVPGAGRALAAAPSVTIDSPVADTTPQAAFTISGSMHQEGSQGTIVNAKVKLSDDDGWLPPVEQNYTAGASNPPIFSVDGPTVFFNWAGISPKYNGPYTVTVSVTGQYRTGITHVS